MKKLLIAMFVLSLQACGTLEYTPETYEIAADRIPDFPLAGTVSVTNDQQDKTPRILFDNGATQFSSNYHAVTAHMVKQLTEEIKKHGQVKNSGTKKTIAVKITSLTAEAKFFHFNTAMSFNVTLGNGKSFTLSVTQGSPASVPHALNGTVALGVIQILKQNQVLKYLEE